MDQVLASRFTKSIQRKERALNWKTICFQGQETEGFMPYLLIVF